MLAYRCTALSGSVTTQCSFAAQPPSWPSPTFTLQGRLYSSCPQRHFLPLWSILVLTLLFRVIQVLPQANQKLQYRALHLTPACCHSVRSFPPNKYFIKWIHFSFSRMAHHLTLSLPGGERGSRATESGFVTTTPRQLTKKGSFSSAECWMSTESIALATTINPA